MTGFVIGGQTVSALLWLLFLAFTQNISFSIVSRSRNRNNMKYHMIAALFSNGIWFLTFRELVKADMTFIFFIPYTIGTISGSVYGAKISMWIEKKIGAVADVKSERLTFMQVEHIAIFNVIENVRRRYYLKDCTVGPSDKFLDEIHLRFDVLLDPHKCVNNAAILYDQIMKAIDEKNKIQDPERF